MENALSSARGLASNGSSKTTSKLFNDLIESSKSLPSASSDLGSIQLSINEINRRAKELRTHANVKGQEDHTKAHYLLAGSGVAFDDVDTSLKLLQKKMSFQPLNGASFPTTAGTPGAIGDGVNTEFTELDSYLKIKKDENILASIEMLLSNAAKDFDNFINTNLNFDWDQRKDTVRENFGILMNKRNSPIQTHTTTLPSAASTGVASMSHSFDKESERVLKGSSNIIKNKNNLINILNDDQGLSRLNVNEHYMLREKFEKYAKIIHRFNNARQSSMDFPLNKEFISILNNSDSKTRQLLESWKILDSLEKNKTNSNVNNKCIKNNNIVINARKYLETQFSEYVDSLYTKKMDEGLPTNINKIKSFIESKLKNSSDNSWTISNLTTVNGIPIWALIFYLLRAGLPNEALEVAINNKSSFKKVEQSFLTYFKAYVNSKDNKLPVEFSTRLHTEYNQHIKSSLNGDPYRLAVYKIIGRCDLTRKNISAITLNVEDWLWIHFMLINDEDDNSMISNDSNNPMYERYTLEEFQNIILSYGSNHFNNYYLQILILSGLYELAIEYAFSINEIDAVHLSIGMANQGIINVTRKNLLPLQPNENNFKYLTINNEMNQREINYTKILTNYTKSFRFSDPRIATEYLILIALISNVVEQVEMCHESLRELVLETKEFTILLGKINREGVRIPGVIEERKPLLYLKDENDFLKIITEQAAHKADEDGRINDSLLLYQLSEEYDIVMTIINSLISDLLSNPDLSVPLIDVNDNSETNIILLGEKIFEIYLNNGNNLSISSKISNKNKETCMLLLKLISIRKSFALDQWEDTLIKIDDIGLLPLQSDLMARKKAQEFSSMNEDLMKCIPNLLIITMTCLNEAIGKLRQNQELLNIEDRSRQIETLKEISKKTMIYAGMIQYKMPRETYSKLIKLDNI